MDIRAEAYGLLNNVLICCFLVAIMPYEYENNVFSSLYPHLGGFKCKKA